MSKRRTAGDVVIKSPNAGFVGEPLKVRICPETYDPPYPPDYFEPCFMDCGDDECREWVNLEVLDVNGNADGYCYHVSECQMEDVPEISAR